MAGNTFFTTGFSWYLYYINIIKRFNMLKFNVLQNHIKLWHDKRFTTKLQEVKFKTEYSA